MAERIKGLRETLGFSAEDMSEALKISKDDYLEYETGTKDFSFSLLFEIALKFGIDITELITGDMPKLSRFSLIRSGKGLPIERRKGFAYQHMAYLFKNRISEPFRVVARYDEALEKMPIALSSHAGQEFDYILSGKLRLQIETISWNSPAMPCMQRKTGTVMAIAGEDCAFWPDLKFRR